MPDSLVDITAIYYTANVIAESFARAVRLELLRALPPWVPILSVSQKPIQFGTNLCIGEIGASVYNVYRQILHGAKAVWTPFVACVEDDTLYVREHFLKRPPPDTFYYNHHRWVISRRLSPDGKTRQAFYYWRQRTQMAMCIAPTALLVETLEERFERYSKPVPHEEAKHSGWGEPGRYEKNLGLTPRKLVYFRSWLPCVTFNHAAGLMGRRQVQPTDQTCLDLPPWGNAADLWRRIYGD